MTVRNRFHEGGLRALGSLVDPVLTAHHRAARLAFARIGQSAIGACSLPGWEQVHTEHVTNVIEPGVAVGNVKMPASNIIQHDRFGSGSAMIWGGISLEGCTDSHTLLGHRQILRWHTEATHYWLALCVAMILNPAISGLMILVFIDHRHIILFSTSYTIYIQVSEDFQLEYFICVMVTFWKKKKIQCLQFSQTVVRSINVLSQ